MHALTATLLASPIDRGAPLPSGSRIARLHDEVALHIVEEAVVVVLDPAGGAVCAPAWQVGMQSSAHIDSAHAKAGKASSLAQLDEVLASQRALLHQQVDDNVALAAQVHGTLALELQGKKRSVPA